MVSSNGDPVSPGLWYFAKEQASPRIGAYMPDYSSDLTVYWRGRVGREDVRFIIEEAESAFTETGETFSGAIDAYGTSDKSAERHVGPVEHLSKWLTSKDIPPFEACRAELTSKQTKVVVWASVSGKETRPLEEGGENISVSIPQRYFFIGPFRPVIVHAIARTLGMNEVKTTTLLNDISTAITKKQLVPGS